MGCWSTSYIFVGLLDELFGLRWILFLRRWTPVPVSIACSAGLFWVGESLFIGSLPWSRHLWFYDRGRLGSVEIITLSVGVRAKKGEWGVGGEKKCSSFSPPPPPSLWLAPFPPLFRSFNMALSRLKPSARARWKRLHCRLRFSH